MYVIANGKKPLRFLSVCSGIEAASQALHRHGFECAAPLGASLPQAQAIAFAQNQRDEVRKMDVAGALASEPGMKQQTYLAYDMRGREGGAQLEGPHDTANLRAADGGSSRSYLATPWAVRRLTPVECERLMGMEDGFTNIPWRGKDFSPDGNRYKELGNSWALNSIDWIGERMAIVDGWDL